MIVNNESYIHKSDLARMICFTIFTPDNLILFCKDIDAALPEDNQHVAYESMA